jgi:hypothetical protein
MPDRFTRLAAVPLTGNGKPDRAAAKRLVDAAPAARDETTTPDFSQTRTTHEPVGI